MNSMLSLIFLNLFFSTISVLPNWNLKASSQNLLDSSTDPNSYTYVITHRAMYKLEAELKKNITRHDNGTITHKNELFINGTSYGMVSFEQIESFYHTEKGKRILCPIGKYDPITLDGMTEITNNITKNDNWDLKCYNHNSGKVYFFVFYFMNGENQVYDLETNFTYTRYQHLQLHSELYDFKLKNREGENDDNSYPICALVKYDNKIQFLATKYGLKSGTIWRDHDLNKPLIDAKAYSKGNFNNNTNHFYFITYNNISDFSSGYSTSTVGDDYYNVNVDVSINNTSPFEFLDK